ERAHLGLEVHGADVSARLLTALGSRCRMRLVRSQANEWRTNGSQLTAGEWLAPGRRRLRGSGSEHFGRLVLARDRGPDPRWDDPGLLRGPATQPVAQDEVRDHRR